jgi:hypothetical protein
MIREPDEIIKLMFDMYPECDILEYPEDIDHKPHFDSYPRYDILSFYTFIYNNLNSIYKNLINYNIYNYFLKMLSVISIQINDKYNLFGEAHKRIFNDQLVKLSSIGYKEVKKMQKWYIKKSEFFSKYKKIKCFNNTIRIQWIIIFNETKELFKNINNKILDNEKINIIICY